MAVEISDILRNHVKEKLARDEVVASMTVRLTRSPEIARMAASAGFDTLYIDVEHNGFSWDTTGLICQAALAAGITPFVRVPNTAPENVAGALNGGALGIIAPHVRSAEDARRVVSAAKFPPLGERGAAGQLPHLQFRTFPAAKANPALDEATTVMVMMETLEALEHVEEIAAVEGMDMMMIGTSDLTAEMGIAGQFDDPRVRAAYERAITACRKHGKHVGVGGLAGRPDLVAEYVRMGARYVSTGTDLGFLMSICTQKAQQVHDLKTR
jgi:4-hydroxy-2-oxoheptanedioate aldolase